MKRWLLRILAASIFMLFGIFLGAIFMSTARPGVHAVVVEVQNVTNQSINKVRLSHERGSVEICNLAAGQKQTLAFFPGGENTYSIKAYLADGRIVEGGGGYVEPGYAMKEIINESEIHTEYNL